MGKGGAFFMLGPPGTGEKDLRKREGKVGMLKMRSGMKRVYEKTPRCWNFLSRRRVLTCDTSLNSPAPLLCQSSLQNFVFSQEKKKKEKKKTSPSLIDLTPFPLFFQKQPPPPPKPQNPEKKHPNPKPSSQKTSWRDVNDLRIITAG